MTIVIDVISAEEAVNGENDEDCGDNVVGNLQFHFPLDSYFKSFWSFGFNFAFLAPIGANHFHNLEKSQSVILRIKFTFL